MAGPEPIRQHMVEIDGTAYPPKQVLAEITGWPRQSFTTMEANRVLLRLGFICRRAGALGPDGQPVWQARPCGPGGTAATRRPRRLARAGRLALATA